MFLLCNHQIVLSAAQFRLPLEHLAVQLSVPHVLVFCLSLQVGFVGQLPVQVPLKGLRLCHESRMIIFASCELSLSRVESLISSSKFKLFGISQFIKLIGPLLRLVKVVINSLDLCIVVLALSLLHGDGISQPVNLVLVACLLFSQLSQLVLQIIGVLPESVGLVALDADLSLKSHALLLSSADLIPDGADLGLVLVVRPVLLVEQEAEVLDLLSEGIGRNHVLIVPIRVVIILHEFLVLEVSILLLDRVQLVSEGDVVFVTLLNLKDLRFQLGNQKILLVASEMD